MLSRIVAGALALIGIWAALAARDMPWGALKQPGPGFFPLLVGVALAGTALVVLAARRAGGSQPLRAGGPEGRPLLVGLAILAYPLALGALGFRITTGLLLLGLFLFLDPRHPARAVLLSAASTLAAAVIFGRWLGVPLPPGVWGF